MDLDFELDDSREKEKNIMTLHVNDISLEIPEELLEDMKNTLHFESNEKMIEEIGITVNALKSCFSPSELEEKSFNDRVIEYIKDENNRQHCLVYLRRISCGADVADERSHMLRHGRGHTARQAVLQIRASVCGSVRQGYKIRRRRAELHCQYFMDNPARLGERSLLRRDGRCLLLHNNRHPARTPVFQIRKARIHAFRLRGG